MLLKLFIIQLFVISVISCTNLDKRPVQKTEINQDESNLTMTKSNKELDEKASSPKVIEKAKAIKLEDLPNVELNSKLNNYCDKLDFYFKKYRWGKSHCNKFKWHHVRDSYLGNPIIWYVFGEELESQSLPHNTTLILCGVHGDEITPIKFCFDVLRDLTENPQIVGDNTVIVAPLVTPDSFLKKYPTRTNARGVDVNRNFPTKDWNTNAISLWKKRYRSDKRRYPGKKPRSEHETVFQINLINRYNPQKIISVHAPLTLLDYDGPTHGNEAGKQLLIQMSDKAGKYKVNDYPFFTGSLGNWAGNERKIPTYTLELPNSDWTKTDKFFKVFRHAIHHAISQNLHPHQTEDGELNEKITNKKNKKNEPIL